ncbi:unnamed protein product [Boreogadus saida]
MRCRGRASQQWDKAFIKAQIEGDHQKLTASGELFNSGKWFQFGDPLNLILTIYHGDPSSEQLPVPSSPSEGREGKSAAGSGEGRERHTVKEQGDNPLCWVDMGTACVVFRPAVHHFTAGHSSLALTDLERKTRIKEAQPPAPVRRGCRRNLKKAFSVERSNVNTGDTSSAESARTWYDLGPCEDRAT